MDRNSDAKWRADIDGSKPGADFFLTRTPAEYSLEGYFEYRGAASSRREDLTYELAEWIKVFSASGKQVLRDVARAFRCQWRSASKFWDELAERESQHRQFKQLMEQRKIDLRRQNILQFRVDGDAMTRELDAALCGISESNQKHSRPKRSLAEVVPEQECTNAPDHKKPTKKVAFQDEVFSSECGSDYIDSNPISARSSLNSIDFKYIDHLIGPGTTSSRLNTSSRLIVGEIDVSEALMKARRDNVKKQCEIVDVSDLLTINFIFDADFLRKHLPTGTAAFLLNTTLPKPTDSEIKLLGDFSNFAATHSYQESKRHLRNSIKEKENSIVTAILLSYTERPGLWKQISSHPASQPSLPQNEDTYTQSIVKSIIFSIVGDLDVVDHWSRDPLPTPHGFEELYFPDYFAELDSLPLFVVEIKKPGAVDDDLEGDQRKLPCMMKLVLDTLLDTGISAPAVIGLLIRGSRCEISSMSLNNEALYIHKSIGVFELPRNNLQLGLLFPAIGPLKFAREMVVETTHTIAAHRGSKRKKNRWCRPSYYVKGNRIPVPKATSGQEEG